MIYRARPGQASSGEVIGILLLDTSVPFIPGDVANATTYDFPVRFRKVEGFSVARAIGKDPAIYEALLAAARDLVDQGVRAVTGDCGFMAFHQRHLAEDLSVPVFLSSLLQIPFILSILGGEKKVGVITADSRSLDAALLAAMGIDDTSRIVVEGLETRKAFYRFAIEESGTLDPAEVEAEMVDAGRKLVAGDDAIGALLLECSLLPPYAAAVQAAVHLPVFDYVTMINFVFSAMVRRPYKGFI
ncbi:aspartate/glutamate racemase family protein [uncultured Desulfosarcina sp.]|uniref:aspartate/glutamate racemase family protein n=1 Tax=uncultured Desulfosarcina sp. TaxID=218289 RepID=UPI0029C60180|nr:aspartate/glutamate racemase family protein [uncultured Desulfosarcina sp.]